MLSFDDRAKFNIGNMRAIYSGMCRVRDMLMTIISLIMLILEIGIAGMAIDY